MAAENRALVEGGHTPVAVRFAPVAVGTRPP